MKWLAAIQRCFVGEIANTTAASSIRSGWCRWWWPCCCRCSLHIQKGREQTTQQQRSGKTYIRIPILNPDGNRRFRLSALDQQRGRFLYVCELWALFYLSHVSSTLTLPTSFAWVFIELQLKSVCGVRRYSTSPLAIHGGRGGGGECSSNHCRQITVPIFSYACRPEQQENFILWAKWKKKQQQKIVTAALCSQHHVIVLLLQYSPINTTTSVLTMNIYTTKINLFHYEKRDFLFHLLVHIMCVMLAWAWCVPCSAL